MTVLRLQHSKQFQDSEERLSNFLRHLKGLLAHSHPNISSGELLEIALCELKKRVGPSEATFPEQRQSVKSGVRYIPSQIKRIVWKRDGGKCTNCNSMYAVQYEHVIPVAKGGSSTIDNLKLLCRSCNQRSAIEAFGLRTMISYLREPSAAYQ